MRGVVLGGALAASVAGNIYLIATRPGPAPAMPPEVRRLPTFKIRIDVP